MVYWLTAGSNITTIAGIIIVFFSPPVGVPIAITGVLVNQGTAYLNYLDRGYGFSVFYTRTSMEFYGQ